MATIEFDPTAFKVAYPAFVSIPDATLQIYWNTATIYFTNQIGPCTDIPTRTLYLNLMTAHLAALSQMVAAGQVPGYITNSTIDKISVTIQAPPAQNQWQWWLNLTPYGQQLLALLQLASVGGFSYGGLPEGQAFRKVYGIF